MEEAITIKAGAALDRRRRFRFRPTRTGFIQVRINKSCAANALGGEETALEIQRKQKENVMKTTISRTARFVTLVALFTSNVLCGCNKFSESILDESAGMNGGFEITESGLPVNWFVYTPETIPTGEYDLIIDTVEYWSGQQSLKFVVRECSPRGGWHSPGFCQQYEATPGMTYTVGFWVKNDGAEFLAKIGGVSPSEGQYETIVRSSETIATWRHYEKEYTMPPEFDSIRFELNILRPGTFWIDEVTISGIP